MVDEKHPVQMVDFMLQTIGQQAIRLNLLGLAIVIQKPRFDPGRAFNIVILIGHGQAAFIEDFFFIRYPDQFRIDVMAHLGRLPIMGQVHDDNTLIHANLGCRQTNAFGGIHGLHHVIHEFAQVIIHRLNRGGFDFQARIGRC